MKKENKSPFEGELKFLSPDHLFRHTELPESITTDELLTQLREDSLRKNYHIRGIEVSKNGEALPETFIVEMSAALVKQMLEGEWERRKFIRLRREKNR